MQDLKGSNCFQGTSFCPRKLKGIHGLQNYAAYNKVKFTFNERHILTFIIKMTRHAKKPHKMILQLI